MRRYAQMVGAAEARRRAAALGDRRADVTWWCKPCAQALLEVHRLPDRLVLVVGYSSLVTLPSAAFVDDQGRTYDQITAGAFGASDEGRVRDVVPTAHAVLVGDRHQPGPLVGCRGGHVREHRASLDVALADLYGERKRRVVPPSRSTLG